MMFNVVDGWMLFVRSSSEFLFLHKITIALDAGIEVIIIPFIFYFL